MFSDKTIKKLYHNHFILCQERKFQSRRILEARNNAIEEARQKVRDYHRHHGL